MPFELWNESYPTAASPAGSIWDYFQAFKRQVRERIATVFPDWGTATDRLTIQKLFVNTGNLTIRNDNDTADIAKVYNNGGVVWTKPYICVISRGQETGDTGAAKLVGNTVFFDPYTWYTADRITVPASFGGKFKLVITAEHRYDYSGGTTWTGETIGYEVYKNGIAFGSPIVRYAVPRPNPYGGITSTHVRYISLNAGDYLEFYRMSTTRPDDTRMYLQIILEKIT